MENLDWQPLQCVGRSGGSMPYHRKRASLHSCAPRSVPLTVDGCTVIQAPVFVARRSWRACNTGDPSSAAVSASYACFYPLCRNSVRPSRRQAKWSAIQNSTWPQSAATRCPMMTQGAVQFSGAVWEGSGGANTACLNGRRVTPRSGTPLPRYFILDFIFQHIAWHIIIHFNLSLSYTSLICLLHSYYLFQYFSWFTLDVHFHWFFRDFPHFWIIFFLNMELSYYLF